MRWNRKGVGSNPNNEAKPSFQFQQDRRVSFLFRPKPRGVGDFLRFGSEDRNYATFGETEEVQRILVVVRAFVASETGRVANGNRIRRRARVGPPARGPRESASRQVVVSTKPYGR